MDVVETWDCKGKAKKVATTKWGSDKVFTNMFHTALALLASGRAFGVARNDGIFRAVLTPKGGLPNLRNFWSFGIFGMIRAQQLKSLLQKTM